MADTSPPQYKANLVGKGTSQTVCTALVANYQINSTQILTPVTKGGGSPIEEGWGNCKEYHNMMTKRRFAALLSLPLLGTTVSAATITVDLDGDGDYLNIQSAIWAASDGDTVQIMPGIYTSTGNTVVWIPDMNITIEGVGDAASIVIDGENARWGLQVDTSDATGTVIRNLTVTRGLDVGIRAYNSKPRIESCILTECNGAALVAVGDAAVAMLDCEVSYNVSDQGPAVWNPGATVTANNCEFHHNEATEGSPLASSVGGSSMTLTDCEVHHNTGDTGGVYSAYSTLIVTDCELHHNHGAYGGAAIYASGTGLVQVTGCDVSWNTSAMDGGAVAVTSGAALEMTSSTIHGNEGRGVMVAFGSDSNIDQCTLTANSANEDLLSWGGAIWLNGGSHTITNSTIAGNTALNGSGIGTNWSTSVSLVGCTIANNTSSVSYGGALFGSYSDGDGRSISNTDFCGNLPYHMDDDFAAGDLGTNTIGGSCVWCSADVDGSLTTGLSDIYWLIENWGPCEFCKGDFNEDSSIGVADLLYVLQEWGCTMTDPV